MMDPEDFKLTEPKVIYSNIVDDIMIWIPDKLVKKVKPRKGQIYTCSEIKYLLKTQRLKQNVKVMHELKKQGLEIVLDPQPEQPDTMAWTAFLSILKKEEKDGGLYLLFSSLRKNNRIYFNKKLNIRPRVGFKEYGDIRKQQLVPRRDVLEASLRQLKQQYAKKKQPEAA